ncbi:MAG TPA: hypothetical protein VK217_13395, partial [Acidimicrobiales bacterium]|nr:hypothetical protein [Acidimicrobiales bacterium]
PHGVKAFRINAGETGGLYDSFQPTSASSGGMLLLESQRGGNGLLNYGSYYTLATGKTTLEAFSPPAPAYLEGTPTVAGSMATGEEYSNGTTSIFYRDLATNASGHAKVPANASYESSSPTGWLLDEYTEGAPSKLANYDLATGKSSILASFPGSFSLLSPPGPDGILVNSAETAEYVTYAGKVRTVFTNPGQDSYTCGSVTTNAVACLLFDGTSKTYSVVRQPLPSGKAVVTKLPVNPQYWYPAPAVTPKATAWLDCGTGATCTLERRPAAGGAIAKITLPRVTGYGDDGLTASGDDFLYGPLHNTSSAGGLFALSDTSTTPTHLLSAPSSPLAAATLDLSSGSVAWTDNSKLGIGIYTRSIKVAGSGITLGASKLLAQSGFVAADASAFGLSLSNAGSEVVYSDYLKQPATDPMGLALYDNGKIKQINSDANYFYCSSFAGPGMGPEVAIAGNYVLFEAGGPISCTPSFSLLDLATGHTCTLSSDNVDYALGNATSGARLVYVSKAGGVYEVIPSCSLSSPKTISPPLKEAGATVGTVTGLGVGGDYIAWGYQYGSNTGEGYVASWENVTGGGVKNIKNPDPTIIVAVVLSSTDIGVTTYTGTGTSLYGLSLPTGAPTLLAVDSYDLSVGNGVAAWINTTSALPYAGKI